MFHSTLPPPSTKAVQPQVLWASAVIVAAFALLGCGGGALPHPVYAPQDTKSLVAISHEPPPARVENAPARPLGATVWLNGEWTWERRRWVWMPGRWIAPPEGATYSPWVTVRGANGALYFAPAQWHDAKGNPIAPPKALAIATVDSGAVVDAEGDMERTTVGTPP